MTDYVNDKTAGKPVLYVRISQDVLDAIRDLSHLTGHSMAKTTEKLLRIVLYQSVNMPLTRPIISKREYAPHPAQL